MLNCTINNEEITFISFYIVMTRDRERERGGGGDRAERSKYKLICSLEFSRFVLDW